MEKRLMTVAAAIAVSTSMAFAQTQVSGMLSQQKMESQSLAHLSRWQAPILVQLLMWMVNSL